MSSGCLLSSSTFFIPAQSSTSTSLECGQFTNTVMATFFGLFVCVCVCVCVLVCVDHFPTQLFERRKWVNIHVHNVVWTDNHQLLNSLL